MGKINRRDTNNKTLNKKVEPLLDPKKEAENKKTVLTLFPGKGKKEEQPIDPARLAMLKKLREEEFKDYKIEVPDSSIRNPSYQKIAQAIINCDGFIMRAAIRLKISYARINTLIKRNPKLRGIIQDSAEAFVDFCENKLRDAIIAGDKSCLIFALKAKGRHRGWADDDSALPIDFKPVTFAYSMILPANCRLITDEGVEVYRGDNTKKEEAKKTENG